MRSGSNEGRAQKPSLGHRKTEVCRRRVAFEIDDRRRRGNVDRFGGTGHAELRRNRRRRAADDLDGVVDERVEALERRLHRVGADRQIQEARLPERDVELLTAALTLGSNVRKALPEVAAQRDEAGRGKTAMRPRINFTRSLAAVDRAQKLLDESERALKGADR